MPPDAAAAGPNGVPVGVPDGPPGDHSRASYSPCTCERPGEQAGVKLASNGETKPVMPPLIGGEVKYPGLGIILRSAGELGSAGAAGNRRGEGSMGTF